MPRSPMSLEGEEPQTMRSAALLSLVLHGLAVYFVEVPTPAPPEPDPIVELTFLSNAARSDVPDEAVGGDDAAPSEPTPSNPPTPPAPVPASPAPMSAPELPSADVQPSAPVAEPQPAPSGGPRMSFKEWQAARARGLPGLQRRALSDQQAGDGGRHLTNSRGTKQCEPQGQRAPDVVFVLIDSSGSMDRERQDQAISCAHQYAMAALQRGAAVGVGNFADQAAFTQPTRDMVEIDAALRSRANGMGTVLPSKALAGLIDRHAGRSADLVIVSDGYLPNYREAMPWYSYYMALSDDNRGYLYTVGFAPPSEVSDAFVRIGFGVFIYRWI